MITETEGIVLKQTQAANGRRMITLFSKQYGKINAGTGISEKGRNKTALALRPFTYGRYVIYKGRGGYNIDNAETLKSYYAIGEDIDKYMFSSYVLELTEKLLPEDEQAAGIFNLLKDFFTVMEKRSRDYETPVIAFVIKALKYSGVQPEVRHCVLCGKKRPEGSVKGKAVFSIESGGIVCHDCSKTIVSREKESLIYSVKFDILNIVEYFMFNQMSRVEKLTMNEDTLKEIRIVLKAYLKCHLDICDLKSEYFIEKN